MILNSLYGHKMPILRNFNMLSKHTQIRWFTTPTKLRDVASKMEEQFKTSRPGDSLQVDHIFDMTNNIELIIVADQSKLQRLQKCLF